MPKKFYYLKTHFNLKIRFVHDKVDLQFQGGKYSTDDPKVQALLEKTKLCRDGLMVVSTSNDPAPSGEVAVTKGISTTETSGQIEKGKSKKESK